MMVDGNDNNGIATPYISRNDEVNMTFLGFLIFFDPIHKTGILCNALQSYHLYSIMCESTVKKIGKAVRNRKQ